MFVHLLCAINLIVLAISNPLTAEENTHLQRECGFFDASGSEGPGILIGDSGEGSVRQSPRARRSMFGVPVDRKEAPWVVSYAKAQSRWSPNMTEEEVLNETSMFCSGSLISKRHVITAAHCVGVKNVDCNQKTVTEYGNNLARQSIIFERSCGDKGTCVSMGQEFNPKFTRKIAKIFMPSYYMGDACHDMIFPGPDIAIIELDREIDITESLYPVCLDDKRPKGGDKLTGYGFGLDYYATDGINFGVLKKWDSTVIQCPVKMLDVMSISEEAICSNGTYTRSCGGDSGSGILMYDEVGRASLKAIHSGNGGVSCGELQYQQRTHSHLLDAFEIQTSVVDHLHWICAATGICASDEAIKEANIWKELPVQPKWFNELLPLPYDKMFVQ